MAPTLVWFSVLRWLAVVQVAVMDPLASAVQEEEALEVEAEAGDWAEVGTASVKVEVEVGERGVEHKGHQQIRLSQRLASAGLACNRTSVPFEHCSA